MQRFFQFILVILIVTSLLFTAECYSAFPSENNTPSWVEITFFGVTTILTVWHILKSPERDSSFTHYTDIDSSSYALKYLLSGDSLYQFLELSSEDERVSYINNFWRKHEPYVFDSQNELRYEFERRLTFANMTYHNIMKKGWRSDRGRIYILYGPPDEKIMLPFQASFFQAPYDQQFTDLEIWIYDKPGGIQDLPYGLKFLEGRRFFLFARLRGEDDYEQIYSSEPDEFNQEYLFQRPIYESR